MIDLHTLCKIQSGLYVVTSKKEGNINGQIASVVFQVTNCPVQIAACISKETLSHEYIQTSLVFGVSILDQSADLKFIGHFGFRSGRDFDKFSDIHYEKELTGCPLVIDHTLVIMEAKVKQCLDLNTHTLFVGECLNSKQIKSGDAMTYEYYHTVIKGKTQENAPTYIHHNLVKEL